MKKDIQYIVNMFGNPNERERYAAGVLPEADLEQMVKQAIRQQFSGFFLRRRLEPSEVMELALMRGKADPDAQVTFEELENVDEFREDEWNTLKAVKKRLEFVAHVFELDKPPETETFWVVARCGDLEMRKAYAKVHVYLGGQDYTLDLCLN